ncbi:MAG TPA: type II toxin-antitoxin system VapC family toxin [Candidatus Tectomicrobia bacterium]
MRLLLDTHAFFWFVLDDAQLSTNASALLVDPYSEAEISPANYGGVAIKISLGKYQLHKPYQTCMGQEIANTQCSILPIEPKHTAAFVTLPFHHRDPLTGG